MSLFGALASGVSGLTAQSSAMGAVADNITNVSTIGYKNTRVNFQTLVTKQTSSTFYSAGGVQSKPRQATDVQGLLNASTSQTDIAISGRGFFVVNEAAEPTVNNQYLYTRSGSFIQDNNGFLKNTSGFFLQAWPTDAAGVVTPANKSLSIPNQNVVSPDYLATVNLNRVGGTAAATNKISIGANLPSNDSTGTAHKTDVQFFDSLGNANTMSFTYTRSIRENNWDVTITPAPGTSVTTLEATTAGEIYQSLGQLAFKSRPADGTTVVIDGKTYEFDPSADGVSGSNIDVDTATNTTVAQDVATLVASVKANDTDFTDYGGFTNNRIQVDPGSSTNVLFTDDGTRQFTVDPKGMLDSSGNAVTTQTTLFTVKKQNESCTDFTQFTFAGLPANGETIAINGITYTFTTTEATNDNDVLIRRDSVANMLADLEASIEANDPNFAAGGTRARIRRNNDAAANDTLVLSTLASGTYNVVLGGTFTNPPTTPDGGTTFAAASTTAVDTKFAIEFDSDGLPKTFNVAEIEILDFANGAANMDDDVANAKQITFDLGTVTEANGFTQFGTEFVPVFITQNGSRFGTFAGVTIAVDGLVTALFDNGETRPIFQIPVATFVNPNELESRSGNVWNTTEGSGDFTLRVADNGPAGQLQQSALEASTVDIGEEFTNLIVVQRAYSASTKVIRVADEMLEELTRIK